MKKIAIVLLAGILAATVFVGCNNNNNNSPSSAPQSSAVTSTEESAEESAEDGEESATEGEKSATEDEESAAEGEESAAEGEESAAEGEESAAEGGTVDPASIVGNYVSASFVNIETNQVITPEEFATANGLEAAPVIYLVLKEDGKAAFGPQEEAKGGTYEIAENGNVTITFEENGEQAVFEYNADNGMFGYTDAENGVGYLFAKVAE